MPFLIIDGTPPTNLARQHPRPHVLRICLLSWSLQQWYCCCSSGSYCCAVNPVYYCFRVILFSCIIPGTYNIRFQKWCSMDTLNRRKRETNIRRLNIINCTREFLELVGPKPGVISASYVYTAVHVYLQERFFFFVILTNLCSLLLPDKKTNVDRYHHPYSLPDARKSHKKLTKITAVRKSVPRFATTYGFVRRFGRDNQIEMLPP